MGKILRLYCESVFDIELIRGAGYDSDESQDYSIAESYVEYYQAKLTPAELKEGEAFRNWLEAKRSELSFGKYLTWYQLEQEGV